MSPVFAYHCCGCYLEQIEGGILADQHDGPPTCRVCKQAMPRVQSAPNFIIKGFNASNRYSTAPSGSASKHGS